MPEWHQYLSLHKLLKCHNYTLFQKACHYTTWKLNCWCRVWKAFLWWYISTFWHDWSFLMKQHKKFDNLFNCKIHARFNEIFVNIIHSQLARVKKGRWKVLKQCMKGPSRWKMKITWPSCQEKPKNHPSTRFNSRSASDNNEMCKVKLKYSPHFLEDTWNRWYLRYVWYLENWSLSWHLAS